VTASAESYAGISGTIIGFGILLSSLKHLAARRSLAGGGFNDWTVLRLRKPWTATGLISRWLERLFSYPAVLGVITLQALSSAVLAVDGVFWVTLSVLLILIWTQLLFRLRFPWGLDGADQITLIVLVGLFCFYLAPPGWLRTACLVFIAAEIVLCYFSAGLAKLFDSQWRSGAAIPMVVRSREFGIPRLSALLDRHAWLGWLLCWSTIVWEISAPIFVMLGPATCLAYIGMGLLFHLSVAVVMGFSDFVWGFTATYPALLFLSTLMPGM
jgi:hypothetical protein